MEGALQSHVEHSINTLKHQFNSQHIRLTCLFDPRLALTYEADFKRLHEILLMLLSQLSVYCTGSAMQVHVRPSTLPIVDTKKSHQANESKMIQISIRDRGYGLPTNVQHGLRSNPHNPSNSIINQIHNIGVGFTLSQYLISTLGGELHFSSSADHGTEMWVDLPMQPLSNALLPKQTPIGTIAILESQITQEDAIEIRLQDKVFIVEQITHADLLKQEVISGFTRYYALLLPDSCVLDVEALEVLKTLQKNEAMLLASAAIRTQYPMLNIQGTLEMPITHTQLEQLICAKEV